MYSEKCKTILSQFSVPDKIHRDVKRLCVC